MVRRAELAQRQSVLRSFLHEQVMHKPLKVLIAQGLHGHTTGFALHELSVGRAPAPTYVIQGVLPPQREQTQRDALRRPSGPRRRDGGGTLLRPRA